MKKRSWMLALFLSNTCFLVAAFAEIGPVTEPVSEPADTESAVKVGRIDRSIIKEFEKAWAVSSAGASNLEGLVLIFRMLDGSYKAKSQGNTNQFKRFSFKWVPNAVAIVHTHPTSIDPRPSPEDQEISIKLGVPVYTITTRGMFLFNPKTGKITKIMDGMDWLDHTKWRYREFLPSTSNNHHLPDIASDSDPVPQ